MNTRFFLYALLLMFLVACGGEAKAACVSSPADQTGALPTDLTGKLLWHSYTSYGDGSSQLFIRDLTAGSTTNISSTWAAASGKTTRDPMNGVWAHDGSWIVFMAENGDQSAWNIWAVKPDGTGLTNLTGSTGTTRNEDPKFNSAGTGIIWKQTQGTSYKIMSAPITLGATASLGTITTMNTDTTENSMPYINAAGTKVYYAAGPGGSFVLKSKVVASGVTTGTATTESTNVSYYPVVRWSDDTVFWADQNVGGGIDQIAYKTGGTGTANYPTVNDCNSNNSDPWPATTSTPANYVFFSSTEPSGYQLYVGDLSNGHRWNLSSWYTDTAKAHLGSAYFGSAGSGGGSGGTGGSCPTSGTDVNLSQGKTASATSTSTIGGVVQAASRAVDGNTTTTRWDSTEPMPLPTTFSVDLGALHHIDGIDLYWESAARAYTVDVSQDNSTWTTIVTQSASGDSYTHKAFPGLSACGRYVRVNGTTADTAYGMALWEFQAWGY